MDLVEGAVVAGRFQLNRKLGQGGMGSVWHATHLGLDIPCAVKFIEGEFAALPEAQARFEREAKAAAQLRSPHVVQILDHGISEGRPYIAMELLDGEDLGKRLIRVGRLSPGETAAVMTQVSRALTKAHSLGVVHRDLKPDNIFLVRDDDREIAKVLDFGIAKSNQHGIEGSNTKTGAMLGTPYYMSPEQAQGTKAVDYRSDLWSLAVIAFQCLTGKLPFESEALGDLLMKIIVVPLPVPSQYGPVPAGFDAWWARAASRDPNGRFQSAKEFADTLASVLGQGATTDMMSAGSLRAAIGAPITPNPSTPHPFGQTPPSAMAQSVVAGGHGGSQPGVVQGVNATTGAPIARTYSGMHEGAVVPPKKSNTGAVVAGVLGVVVLVGVGGSVAFMRSKNNATHDAPAASQTTPITTTTTDPPKATTDPAKVEAKPAESAAKPAETAPAASSAASEATVAKKEEPTPREKSRRSGGGTTTSTAKTTATPPPAGAATPPKPKSDMEKKVDQFGF